VPHHSSTSAWRVDKLRLPKSLEGEAKGTALHAAMRERAWKLWDGGMLDVPTASWGPKLEAALREAVRDGQLVRGLELIEKTLEGEARGLSLVDARTATERGARVSRLLLLSQDGSERFYRQAERIVSAQGERVLVVRIEVDSDQLAAVVPDASGVVRALLVQHKDSVARVLMALYP
jgi:hypothetical protein